MTAHSETTADADGDDTLVSFADAVPPALVAGDYEVEVTQEIAGDIDGIDADNTGETGRHEYRHVQPMRVTGPHFGLGPRDVFSVHPPAGTDADWSGFLPSVVFAERGLPWLIALRAPTAEPQPAPWLAVLLLTSEELAAAEPETVSPTGSRQIPLADYLVPPPGVRGPAFTQRQIARFQQEHPADFTVTALDIPGAMFSNIAPSLRDAQLLAHTRMVRDGVRGLVDELAVGDYAVVVGNRLVDGSASGVYIAHLVSLEGFEDALPPAAVEEGERIRLLSLAAWSFTSRRIGGGFREAMQGLHIGPLKLPDALGSSPTTDDDAAPQDDDAELVKKALALGYTATDYRTRLGERTVAWYRGPLLPVAMKPNPQPPFRAAEAALVYDSDTGMFDVSFAVAWQAGRLLALADREIAVALADWVRRSRRALVRALGRDRLRRTHPLLGQAPEATASARSRALMAAELAPSNQKPDIWGPPIDLSGMLEHVGRLPGLIGPEDLPRVLSGPGTPTGALLAALRSNARTTFTSTAAAPPPAPASASAHRHPHTDSAPRPAVGRLPSELRALMANPDAAADALRNEPLPPEVEAWLAQLALLHGIPFSSLVPDTRMLPPESMRFAYLDRNWIGALLDGALSVAAVDEPDHAVLDLLRPAAHGIGPFRGPDTVLSGFLLRSAAVADWPGLRIEGYADRAGLRPLPLRRIWRPSPTVLVALFEGRVGRVDVAEPAQGTGFGVLFTPQNPSGEVSLRGLGGAFGPGVPLPGPAVPVPLRPDDGPGRRVVEVATLHATIGRILAERYAPAPAPLLGPGAFGLQLVAGGELQVFDDLDGPAAEPAAAPETGGRR